MTLFFFFLGLAECVLLWTLGLTGSKLAKNERKDWEKAAYAPEAGWPACALVIPVAGNDPRMGTALRSLLEQDYPNYKTYIVTARGDNAAEKLLNALVVEYTGLKLVKAPIATKCGQKNENLLAGIQEAAQACDVLAFCDSTHVARHDFLRCLLRPLAAGQAEFSTGYHKVIPQDSSLLTIGYALSVMFMRLMQGMAFLTQPWGGAMAMTRGAFVKYDVASLWADNVVDDCSLAGFLNRAGARVRLCPGAILQTQARGQTLSVWSAWMERQILFLKFCIPGQWIALGVASLCLVLPPLWMLAAFGAGLMGAGGGMAPFLALCWLCMVSAIVCAWRRFLPKAPAISIWTSAFFLSCILFAIVYARTIFAHCIVWHNISYKVGAFGRVLNMHRTDTPFDRKVDAK